MALTDALDDLISEGRIAPQLAMKILSNFDKHVMEVLDAKVRANLTFKVRCFLVDPLIAWLGHSRGRGCKSCSGVSKDRAGGGV